MASINKNFVVKNGLEISTNLIYADSGLNKVGFGTTLPQTKLDVLGDINADGYVNATGSIRGSDASFTGFTTATNGLNVGTGGTALTIKYYPNSSNRVGINTIAPKNPLEVYTGAGQTAAHFYGNLIVDGTVKGTSFDGQISAGGTAGFSDLIVTGIITANNKEIYTKFDIINNGTTAYQYQSTGIGFTENRDNPTIYLNRGANYRFDVNSVGSPFYLKTTRDTGISNQYSPGVQNNGAQVGIITFKVPFNAPKVLYYQSSANTSMGGTIYVLDQGAPGINTDTFTSSNLDVTSNVLIGGITTTAQLNVTGVSTFSGGTFVSGDLSVTGNVTLSGVTTIANLSLSGNTNFENTISVVGVATFGSDVTMNAMLGVAQTVTAPEFVGNLTGVAASAAILQTPRSINDVPFDGSADITVDVYVESDDSSNAERFVTYVDNTATSNVERLYESANFTYNPSLNRITATTFSGNATSATNATNATNANNLVVVDESASATGFPVFTTSATGAQQPKTDASALTYDASTGTLSALNVNSTSDITLKKDIQVITNATDMLKQINGVKFNWIVTGRPSAGVIAQEVEQILPELIAHRADNGVKSVNYDGLVGVLVEAVKELTARVEQLESGGV